MRIFYFVVCVLGLCFPTLAQDIVGFPRKEFGQIVLSQRQFSGRLETSIGNYNNEPISKYGSESIFATLGRPIGRLDILTDAGLYPCTAFLISEKYALTNYHCVPGITNDPRVKATSIDAIQLVLGYTKDGIEHGVQRFSVSTAPVEIDERLDFAVLEVFGNPSQKFGTMKLARRPPRDYSPLWIIGHPMGEAQRISRENCLSDAPAIAGGRLRHRCDTLPGNSGSPVIDPSLGSVVAVHHAGSSRNSINYAIPLRRIARRSRIVAALVGRDHIEGGSAKRDRPTLDDRRQQAPGEAKAPLSEAARTWSAIKDSSSVAVLKSFAEKYSGSVFATFALARAGELERNDLRQAGPGGPPGLALALQRELKRVGCYAGRADGIWGRGSSQAMSAFNKHARVAFSIDSPTTRALAALKAASLRVCPERPPAGSPPESSSVRARTTFGAGCRWESGHSCKNRECGGMRCRHLGKPGWCNKGGGGRRRVCR